MYWKCCIRLLVSFVCIYNCPNVLQVLTNLKRHCEWVEYHSSNNDTSGIVFHQYHITMDTMVSIKNPIWAVYIICTKMLIENGPVYRKITYGNCTMMMHQHKSHCLSRILIFNFLKIKDITTVAVSYTHLDVYKRQVLISIYYVPWYQNAY